MTAKYMDIHSAIIISNIILTVVAGGSIIFFILAGCSIYTILTSGVPWAKTPAGNIKKIFKEISLPKDSLIYDLGAGDGRVLFIMEKLGYRGIGYELSLYPYLKARFKKMISGSAVKFKRQDFFKADLSRANAVFVFLVGKVMDRVGRQLKSELKKGTVVASYGFIIPGWTEEKIIQTKPSLTYVYKI
jgi:SAM-dependent methyltransferase